jgi:hypothetical protein
MALYTAQLTKQIIDPQYHSNSRTELRLDNDKLYLPRLRLVNLSARVDATAQGASVDYLNGTGVYSLIKNAFLYSGSQVIDQLLDANRFLNFKQFNRTNENHLAFRPLTGDKTSYYYGQDQQDVNAATKFLNLIRIDDLASNLPSNGLNQSPSSWINLRDLFPVLRSMQFLSTSLMPNLRVVLEYETDRNATLTGNTGTIVSIYPPEMIVEYLDDLEVKAQVEKSFKPIVWNCIENDSVFLPNVPVATAPDPQQAEQSINWRLNAFNNKLLTRVLVQKQKTNNAGIPSPSFGILGSEAMPDEKFNLKLNGSSVHNQEITTHAEILSMVVDAWGDCVNFPSYSSMPLVGGANLTEVQPVLQQLSLASHNSYFGLTMPQQRVQDLQLSYKRNTSTAGTANKEALKFNVFGEVPKVLSIQNNKITVSYL